MGNDPYIYDTTQYRNETVLQLWSNFSCNVDEMNREKLCVIMMSQGLYPNARNTVRFVNKCKIYIRFGYRILEILSQLYSKPNS